MNIYMKKLNKNSLTVLIFFLALGAFSSFGLSSAVAATAIDLGSASSFSVLSGTPFLSNTGSSVITGDIGLSPATGAGITGFPPGLVNGTIYAVDAAGPAGSVNNPTLLTAAKNDLTTAYLAAASSTPDATITSDLSTFRGGVLTPGVYNSPSSVGLTGTVILDGQGNPNAVFIIQAGSSLTTAASSSVVLINGAQACNVFWQVGTSAGTLGANSVFKGNILSLTSVTLVTGANVEGRVLARNGAVTLDSNIITKPTCTSVPGSLAVAGINNGATGGVPPLIDLTKTPNPSVLPAGGGSVTYTYKVKNIGTVPFNQVLLIDNMCNSRGMKFISSDRNGSTTAVDSSSWLAVNETWTYSCTTNVAQTTTNTATVTGVANGVGAFRTANATVVVGAPLPPPLIHVVKTPNVFLLPSGGGAVTYTYTVTNPGTVPLSDVSVVDNKCTGLPGRVVGHPGDLNKNNLLESNESWSFTCLSNLTQTTTNIATAEGHANGLTAIDFAPATVVVTSPKLPNTGIAPEGGNAPWSIVIPIGAFVLALGSVFLSLRKRAINN